MSRYVKRYRESLLYDCTHCGWDAWTRYRAGIIPIYVRCPECGERAGRSGEVKRHDPPVPLAPGDYYWLGDTLRGPQKKAEL